MPNEVGILVFASRGSSLESLIPKYVFNLNIIKPYHVIMGTVFDVKNGVMEIETTFFNTSHCILIEIEKEKRLSSLVHIRTHIHTQTLNRLHKHASAKVWPMVN